MEQLLRVPIFRGMFLSYDCCANLIEEGQNRFNVIERRGLFEHDALWDLLLFALSVALWHRSLLGQVALIADQEE